jgi:hypothetical protein
MKKILSLLCATILSYSTCQAGIVLDMISEEIDNAQLQPAQDLEEANLEKDLSQAKASISLSPKEISYNKDTQQIRALYNGFLITVDLASDTYGLLTYYSKTASGWDKKGGLTSYTKVTFKNKECFLHVYDKYKIYTNETPEQVIVVN